MVSFRLTKKQIFEIAHELLAERTNVNPWSIPHHRILFATSNMRYAIWEEIEVVDDKIYYHFYINE